jgi:hypothetical protein
MGSAGYPLCIGLSGQGGPLNSPYASFFRPKTGLFVLRISYTRYRLHCPAGGRF